MDDSKDEGEDGGEASFKQDCTAGSSWQTDGFDLWMSSDISEAVGS